MAPLLSIAGSVIGLITLFAITALIARLHRVSLLATYWPLAGYLAAVAFDPLILLWFPRHSLFLYQATNLFMTLFAGVLLWRLSQLVFDGYPALRSFALKAVRHLIPVCLLLSIASFMLDPAHEASVRQSRWAVALIRAADTGILSYLLAMAVFAGWFPVRLRRNVGHLLIGSLAWFLAQWAATLLANLHPTSIPWSNLGESVVGFVVSVFWLLQLGPAGEQMVVSPVPQSSPERLAHATYQLEQIQAHLSRQL